MREREQDPVCSLVLDKGVGISPEQIATGLKGMTNVFALTLLSFHGKFRKRAPRGHRARFCMYTEEN